MTQLSQVEAEFRPRRCYLVPDQRHLPMQLVRVPVQRTFSNRSDKGGNDVIVDFARFYPMGDLRTEQGGISLNGFAGLTDA